MITSRRMSSIDYRYLGQVKQGKEVSLCDMSIHAYLRRGASSGCCLRPACLPVCVVIAVWLCCSRKRGAGGHRHPFPRPKNFLLKKFFLGPTVKAPSTYPRTHINNAKNLAFRPRKSIACNGRHDAHNTF